MKLSPILLPRVSLLLFILCSLISPVSAVKNEYILCPGDVITINVLEHDEFSQKAKIRPDGLINYPVIGEIEVGGSTTSQLVKLMEEKLSPYVNNVVVNINIESYFSNKIYILGAVSRSGEYEIFEPVDVIKALSMAGGMRDQKTKELRIVRANGDVYSLDMAKFFSKKSGKDREAFTLYPGDTLFVPESFQFPWSIISTIASVAVAVLTIVKFFVS
jgi:polysaccharide export outer membrane protein